MRRTQKLLVPSIWALSVVVAASGSAFAAAKITGKQIVDGSITGKDIKNGSLTAGDIDAKTRNALINAAVAKSKNANPSSANAPGAAGKDGVNGTNGAKGDKGDKGERGFNADGSLTVPVTGAGVGGFVFTNRGADQSAITTTFENGGVRFVTNGNTGASAAANFGFPVDSVPASQLTSLVYKFTKSSDPATSVAPAVRITVKDATACDVADPTCDNYDGTSNLEFEPIYADPAVNMAGATVDLLSLKGWYAKRDIKGATMADSATPTGYMQTLGNILQNNPNLKITRIAVEAYAGAPWHNFDGSVDFLQVGFAGAPATRYDFG